MHTDWTKRLHNWTPDPPKGGWERLDQALPDAAKPAYARKLYEYDTAPSPGVWNAVVQGLDKNEPGTPVFQMYPRKKWLRIASVAASILFAIYFLPALFTAKDQTNNTAATPALQQSVIPFQSSGPTQLLQPEESPIATITVTKKNATSSNNPVLVPLPPKTNDPLPIAETEKAAFALMSNVPQTEGIHMVSGDMERYIILPVADDAAVRLPKKLYAAYRCDEQPDPTGCWERLAILRQQLAAPSVAGAADFLGVLEAVQNMGAVQ